MLENNSNLSLIFLLIIIILLLSSIIALPIISDYINNKHRNDIIEDLKKEATNYTSYPIITQFNGTGKVVNKISYVSNVSNTSMYLIIIEYNNTNFYYDKKIIYDNLENNTSVELTIFEITECDFDGNLEKKYAIIPFIE